MSVILTAAQAAALATVAAEHSTPLQLHQVGEDPDLFVTTSGQGEPDLRIDSGGTVESLPGLRT